VFTKLHIINIHVSYSLHSIDCNLADGEYVLIPEEGVAQEGVQEPAAKPAIEDLLAVAFEGKPRSYV
jgi:hydrogenase maturation factor